MAISEFDLELADHLIQIVKIDDHILQEAVKTRLQSQYLDGTCLSTDLSEYFFHLFWSFTENLQSQNVCQLGPSFTAWHIIFNHDFLDFVLNAQNSLFAAYFSIWAKNLSHIICKAGNFLLTKFSDETSRIRKGI